MTTALRKGLKIQRGAETTWGTGVAATAILAGLNEVRYGPDDALVERDELNGILTRTTDGPDVLGTAGKVYLSEFVTYQDFPYVLEGAYKTASPSADGGSPIAYTRTYSGTLTAEDTPKPATLEAGGLTEAFQFPGSVVGSFELTAGIRGYTMATVQWIAKDMIPQAFTGSLSRRTVTRVKSGLWIPYLDTSWAGLGGSAMTECVTNIAFRSGTRFTYANCIQGATTPTGVVEETAQQAELTLTMKLDAATLALFTNYRAGDVRFIRLKNSGATAIHDAVFPKLQLDFAGYIANWPEVGQAIADNALTIPVTWRSTYDTTSGKDLLWTSINSVATLP